MSEPDLKQPCANSASAIRSDLPVLPKSAGQDSETRRCFVSGGMPQVWSDRTDARGAPGSLRSLEWERNDCGGSASRFVVTRMAIFRSLSSFFDGAEVSFQFYGCNRITWHLHLLEPCGQGSLIRSLHNAYNLSLRQVEKTSIRLHRRVVLGGLCDLVDLFARQGASRHGMAAHEFRHHICSFLLCYFGVAVLCGVGFRELFAPKKTLGSRRRRAASSGICLHQSRNRRCRILRSSDRAYDSNPLLSLKASRPNLIRI
jgi:hypothetical protein